MKKYKFKPENTYIMNLEAAYIYKDIQEGKKTKVDKKDYNKLFTATIPYSLETIRINENYKNSFYEYKEKQYSKKIINVTFDENYFKWDNVSKKRNIIASKDKIRNYLYNNGFEVDGKKYVFYKRGAGKAKNGYALFIQRHMKNKLLKRSRLGLSFEPNEKLDLTSLLAYESLVSSEIISTINLDPQKEILLINDIYGKKFKTVASVTREEDGKIVTSDKEIELQNCLSDGQGLMDKSVFSRYGKKNKGFMLLRSDMFKCCAFNTNLQEWFEDNGVVEVKDMFGNTYKASEIKLVTTPNSLKFLKFAYKFGEQEDSKSACYEHWKNNIDSKFGVVKYDSEGNYGNYNRLTYQLINSIPDLTFNDLMEITKEERQYVDLLKNNEAVFRNHILKNNELSYMIEERLESGDLSAYESMDSMYLLFLVNPDIQYTRKFKKIKSDIIANYVQDLKKGKIRVKDAKYTTLISNPYEMLLASIGKYKGESIMSGRELYCPYYKDGEDFCVSRNPHINAGNVMHSTNKYHAEFEKWFNFTDNICVINFFDNDAPDRLQGCDTDSDTVLLIPNNVLSSKAKICEEKYTTPINMVKGESKDRKYNMKEIKKLDSILSNNYIGKIVNMSQIVNSYMNDAIHNNKPDYIVQELYQASSKLSSLSQIEIDKSKKVFDNVSMFKELNSIKSIESIKYKEDVVKIEDEDVSVNKMIVPAFFEMISDSNTYRILKKFDTPLDTLQDVLIFKGGKRLPNKKFEDLLVKPTDLNPRFPNYYQISSIYEVISKYGKKINGLMLKTCLLNDKAKSTIRRNERAKAVEKLISLGITPATTLNVLRRCFKVIEDEYGFSKYAMTCLNLLLVSNKANTLKCFLDNNIEKSSILIEGGENLSHNIFGKAYQEIPIKDVKFTHFN